MIAWRRAMRCTPIARVIVTMAGNSSGMALTARATAASNISPPLRPLARPTSAVSIDSPSTKRRTVTLKRPNLRVSGVESGEPHCREAARSPSSVASPVATTTPRPWPVVTKVPA
jgi:hypothetical protein